MDIELYYDEIIMDGIIAKTSSGNNILYNVNKINSKNYQELSDMIFDYENGEGSVIMATGKYVSVVSINMNLGITEMVTLDCKGNDDLAAHFANKTPKYYTLFMQEYRKTKSANDELKFVRKVGVAPVKSI